ncbi:MAG: MFS transporter [Betaproteobacteria bacterium]|nr:MFS transporter [Betaproteobacteria bacterium]
MRAPASLSWTVWALGASFYFAGFFHRVAPAVMTQELMAEFAIAATGLGNLSAFYLYGYVAMQIPTGLMVDRYGARRVLAAGAATAALGSFLFAFAPSLFYAQMGRLLIGAAVGVSWVGTLKLAAHWVDPRRFALVTGLTLAAGLSGALGAGVPLRWGVEAYGWRPVMVAAALCIALMCVAIWLVVRDDPAERGYRSWFAARPPGEPRASVWRGLREVLRYRNTWAIFISPQGLTGTTIAFGGLWGVPFLVSAYGFTQERAAFYCSMLMLSWAVGGPLCGAFSDRIGARKPLYVACALGSLLAWSAIVLFARLPAGVLLAVLVIAGLLAGVMVTGFAWAKESVPARLAGTATGVSNMGAMTGPMVLQPVIGVMLDLNWHGALAANGARLYDAAAYRSAFSLFLVWLAISFAVSLLTRETHCQQRA